MVWYRPNESFGRHFLEIAVTLQIVALLLNYILLSRGTFPADSKRGRICLLHDLDGDSDFEDDAIQLKLFAIAFTLLVTYNVKYYYSKVTLSAIYIC